jgi:hypothetical protein
MAGTPGTCAPTPTPTHAVTSSRQVGEHKASSKTELKTLEPRWNETMCFSAEDVADAVQGARPLPPPRLLPGAPHRSRCNPSHLFLLC